MALKNAVTWLLLAFVTASVGYQALKEYRGRDGTQPHDTSAANAAAEQGEPAVSGDPSAREVIVYYFHGNMRCVSCQLIETLTTQAVTNGFPEAINEGRIKLEVVNVEDPPNSHYVQDYQLSTRSVVVATFESGVQKDWKRLDRVWELVRDKEAFLNYVRAETAAMLETKGL